MKKLILILMIIGGINWGLIGFFNYNLNPGIFGAQSAGRFPHHLCGCRSC